MSDDPGHYAFADPPPPKRKWVRPPKKRFEGDEQPERDDRPDPWWAFDWFYPALLAALVLWAGLGIIAMKWHAVGFALAFVGLLVIAFGRCYLFMLIREQDGWEQSLLAFLFDWHRYIYLYQNIELTLKPNVLSFVGFLMTATGLGLTAMGLRPRV